jgi:hypothetical protein
MNEKFAAEMIRQCLAKLKEASARAESKSKNANDLLEAFDNAQGTTAPSQHMHRLRVLDEGAKHELESIRKYDPELYKRIKGWD